MKKLNSNHLKLIAIIAMTIDHVADLIFPGMPNNIISNVLHIIGRLTAPIMFFFICEGFYYTPSSDKIKDLFAELSELLVKITDEIEKVNIEDVKKEKSEKDAELTKIFEEISELVKKMEELEKQAIMNAKVS